MTQSVVFEGALHVRARVCVSVSQFGTALRHCCSHYTNTISDYISTVAGRVITAAALPAALLTQFTDTRARHGLEPATSLLSYRCYGLQTTPRP